MSICYLLSHRYNQKKNTFLSSYIGRRQNESLGSNISQKKADFLKIFKILQNVSSAI